MTDSLNSTAESNRSGENGSLRDQGRPLLTEQLTIEDEGRQLCTGEKAGKLHETNDAETQQQELKNEGRQLCNGDKGRQLHETNDAEDQQQELNDEVVIEYVDSEDDDDHGIYKWIVVFSCFILHFIIGRFICENSDLL